MSPNLNGFRIGSRFLAVTAGLLLCAGCGQDTRDMMDTTGSGLGTTGDDGTGGDDSDGGTTGQKYDVADGDETQGDDPGPSCKVMDDGLDAPTGCDEKAPAGSFDPEIQWSWTGGTDARYSFSTPLVGNLTDDNGDGEIDLCDTPDIVVIGYPQLFAKGSMYVLDGATGAEHFKIDMDIASASTAALGDIDGDGVMEIVVPGEANNLLAFNHDGSLLWQTENLTGVGTDAVALADLDNDGDVEIIIGYLVLDHEGNVVWSRPEGKAGPNWIGSATTAADLNDDGNLEVIMGPSAYFPDGELFWFHDDIDGGFPQVADLDDDGEPEILFTNQTGFTIFEADGTIKVQDQTPTGDPGTFNNWVRPAAVHDFDGDGRPGFAISSGNHYSVFEPDGSVFWTTTVDDGSGTAASTAFDFLGDGVAEAIYGDENDSMIFDGKTGEMVLATPRTSRTYIEYPVVADVDNDGSAEIVVTSSDAIDEGVPPSGFTVHVVQDAEDRWIQARRIWNQHTYHVTNVREDGTIPQFEKPSWEVLNTFRTNAQISDGGVCKPVPEG